MTTAQRLRRICGGYEDLGAEAADELEALTTELSAWKTSFGTQQLSHAVAERDELRATLSAAYSALRSYQYGNSSPELAEKIADATEAALKGETK